MNQRSTNPLISLLAQSPVLPVLTIPTLDAAVPLAKAFLEGGIKVIEITLRTEAALSAIREIKQHVPEITIGAGTVLQPTQFEQVKTAGADFAVSPGLTASLAEAAAGSGIPYLPGVATASEIMRAREVGFDVLKFFPAECAGGVDTLKSMQALFPDVKFVPTGQITTSNMDSYFDCDNVLAVGGSWIATKALIEHQDWGVIAELAEQVVHHQRGRAEA